MSDDDNPNVVELPDNVVQLNPQSPPTMEVVRGAGRCFHQQVTVSVEDRKVHCARCGDEMDPFRALLDFAQRMQLEGSWVADLRRQKKNLAKQVEELKREERNTKARLKRAQAKLRIDTVVEAGREVIDVAMRQARTPGNLPTALKEPLQRLLRAHHEYEQWPRNVERGTG